MLTLRVGAAICQPLKGKLGKKGYVSGRESRLSWLQCSGTDTIPDRLEKDTQNNLLNEPISCG